LRNDFLLQNSEFLPVDIPTQLDASTADGLGDYHDENSEWLSGRK
jgi:hypothetical protein